MVRVRHPDGADDDYVDLGGDLYAIDDGVADVPERLARQWANRHGLAVEDIRVGDSAESESEADTCAATTADDEPCSNPAGDDGYCHIPSHGPD